jgi:hypothetical protein
LGVHQARRELLRQDVPLTVDLVAARAFPPPVVAQEHLSGLKMEPQDVLLREWRAAQPQGPRDEWELGQAHLPVAWPGWAWPPQAQSVRELGLQVPRQEPQPRAQVARAEQPA